MAFHFGLALLAAVLLNGAVLGDDSTSSGALAGADGERNAPSRGGDAGCKSEGRARNGDKLVVLDSARTTPSETVRKSVSVVKRMSGQSSLSSRNEAGNDHAAVGNELHDQPATTHKAQASVGDKHGMKLPHARRPTTSQHSEGGLSSTSPKESAGIVDRKKEFENVVSGIIAEEAENSYEKYYSHPESMNNRYPPYNYDGDGYPYGGGQSGDEIPSYGGSSVQSNNSTSESAPGSTQNTASSPDNSQSSVTGSGYKDNTKDGEAKKYGQEKEKEKEEEKEREREKEKEKEKEKEEEKGEKQLEQRSNENSDGLETNNSSEDVEKNEAPSSGNFAFLCGSYSSVLLVALTCLCACAC
ncbi:hypothetical protein ERJ75_000180700 [Trypanosoma vivax]|nr:hypothetical protein ERJ75_000180700 [Trypanosoma vivax]